MRRNQAGFTIVEIMVVILIIGLIARVALPTVISRQGDKIGLAAAEIAAALRFARDDAIRSGGVRGIRINRTTGQVTAYRPDLAVNPVTVAAVLYNPLTKQPYDFNIMENSLTAGVSISNPDNPFKYRSSGTMRSDIFFDGLGMPVFISGAQRHHLESGAISLASGNDTRSVVLSPFTGRIFIQ